MDIINEVQYDLQLLSAMLSKYNDKNKQKDIKHIVFVTDNLFAEIREKPRLKPTPVNNKPKRDNELSDILQKAIDDRRRKIEDDS